MQTAGCNRNVHRCLMNKIKTKFPLFSTVTPLYGVKCFLKGPYRDWEEQHCSWFFTLKSTDYLKTFLVNSDGAANEKAPETNHTEATTTSLWRCQSDRRLSLAVVISSSWYVLETLPRHFLFTQYLNQFHLFVSYTARGTSAVMVVAVGYVTLQLVWWRAVLLLVSDHSWAWLGLLKGIFCRFRNTLVSYWEFVERSVALEGEKMLPLKGVFQQVSCHIYMFISHI